jgi:hypothetical protein
VAEDLPVSYWSLAVRWRILRVLLHKEILRHVANRGAILLILLLVAAAFLLSVFGKKNGPGGSLLGAGAHCYLDYWEDGPNVEYLRRHIPAELKDRITLRLASDAPTSGGKIVYPPGAVAIQLRIVEDGSANRRQQVHVWNADKDGTALAPFEGWFWKASYQFLQERIAAGDTSTPGSTGAELLSREEERSELEGAVDARSSIATSLVLFGLFFVCVYLLPSLTCEERERGVLLAQALSPASPVEILAARFLFYPVVGMALAALLAGIYSPAALARPFFWMALVVAAVGSMGVGLTISTLARTQRAASMGALCYMLAVALILVICQQNSIPGVPWLALEFHFPRMFQAVLADTVRAYHWWHLVAASVLSVFWSGLATVMFRRYGWQ